jgi:small neutral amino acid transporter SnatA (MarC family)
LVLLSGTANCFLAFTGKTDLSLYLSLYIIVFLIVTLLFSHISPRVRKTLNYIGLTYFGLFLAMVAVKVIAILTD